MIIPIELRFKADKDSKTAFRTDKTIKSHDVNSVEFHISIDGLDLTGDYTAKILSIFHRSKSQINKDCEIVEGKIIYKPDTNLISMHEHVSNYVYVYNDNQSLDVSEFTYVVNLSKIDETSLEIKEVYDQSYADLLADFEQALSDYKDTLPQADSVRAEVDEILNQVSSQAVADWKQDADALLETVEDNESARVDAETTRKTTETDRVSSETTRKTNETTRISNENARKSAESVRVANEEERELNEAERISKDSERDSKIEVVEEGLEQHKMDYVEDTKRARATEPLGKLLAYDTFNRPDGSLGVSDSGHPWISYGPPAVISSGFHKGGSANNTLYDVSAIALGDEIRRSVLKVDVFKDGAVRGAGLFLGVDQKNGINLFSFTSSLNLVKIVEGVRTNLYQSATYSPWGETDPDWYIKERVLQTLELTTVYVDSAVLFNVKIILNGVEFSEKIKITDPETLGIISNANKVGITQTHNYWYAKNFVARGLGV